ncbi:MAG: PilZ domain-containing protein [Fimbriimonadaceae bacterium]
MSTIHTGFSPSLYLNTRCTFQRIKDARIFHGWVESLDEREITLRVGGDAVLTEGDEFVFQVFGLGQNLKFLGRLTTRLSGTLVLGDDSSVSLCMFAILGEIKIIAGDDSARMSNQGMFALIKVDDVLIDQNPIEIADVSKGGLGVVLPVELPKGTRAMFQISSIVGEINLEAQVMNVRPATTGFFRHGFAIREMSRIDGLRWGQNFKRNY